MKDTGKIFSKAVCFLVVGLFVALCGKVQAQTTVKVTYNVPGSNYSLSLPDGVWVKMEAWGGGAGGGVGVGGTGGGGYGGGGGGGGYVHKNITSNSTTLTIQVATGGNGGIYGANQDGSRGGVSRIDYASSFCLADGGYGGGGGTMGNGTFGYGGGFLDGDDGIRGENGTVRIGSASGSGGKGGGNDGGAGGAGQESNAVGYSGSSPGGGGSGGRMGVGLTTTGYNGGNGARGEVWITLTFPTPAITSSSMQICSGSNVVLNVTNPANGVTYLWYRDGMHVGNGSSYTTSQTGGYTVKAEYPISHTGGNPTFLPALGIGNVVTTPESNTVTLVAGPSVQFNPITLDDCSGTDFSITPIDGTHGVFPIGTSYSWTIASNTGVDGVVAGSSSGGNTISLGTLTNPTSTVQTVVYNVTPFGGGCTGNSFQITVNVKPRPQVRDVMRYVCSGENINIIPTDGTDGIVPNGTTYSWTVLANNGLGWATGGNSGNSGTMPMGTHTNTTLAPVSVIYNVIPVYEGCTGDDFMLLITINPEINVSLIGDYDTYCAGSNSQLTASVLPHGNYTYDWYLDNTFIATGQNNGFASAGLTPHTLPYAYHVIAKSPTGCMGTSNDFSVTVKNRPIANVTLNHTDICPGGSITATINVFPTDNYDYKWYLNNVESGYQSQFTVDNLLVSTHFIYAEVISNALYNGCDVNSGAVAVKVHSNPVVYISADEAAICIADTAVVKAINVVHDAEVKRELNYAWQWAINGVEVENAVQDFYRQSLTNAGTYNFSVRMKQNDDLGCASDWSAPVTVTVEDVPQVLLVSDNHTYCAGGSVNLSVSSIPAVNTYDWYVDNTLLASGGNNTIVSQENARTSAYNYSVIARSALGCEGTSNNIHIYVADLPTAIITADYTDICPGGSITVTANVSPIDNYNYKWYVNGIESGNQQQLLRTNLSVGQDTVYVEASPAVYYNGCEAVSTPLILTVHPNPVVTVLADHTALCDEGTVELTSIISFNGNVRNDNKLIYSWSLNGTIIDNAVQSSYTQTLGQGTYNFAMRVEQNDDLGCASNWSAPVVVTVSHTEIPSFITADCKEDVSAQNYRIVNIPIDVQAGSPQSYSVFVNTDSPSLRHFGMIQYNSPLEAYIEAHLPLQAGDYELIIDIDGCKYATTARVLVDEDAMGGAKLIEQRWNDVLTVNNNPKTNGGFAFYSYQWYKNDVLISGATKQFYTEPEGKLNGVYHVALSGYAVLSSNDTVEISYVSCPFVPTVDFSVAVFPVPTNKNMPLTLKTSLSADELTDAVLEIYNVMGVLHRQITVIRPEMSIDGFEHGVYFGRLTTKDNGTHNFRFVVVE